MERLAPSIAVAWRGMKLAQPRYRALDDRGLALDGVNAAGPDLDLEPPARFAIELRKQKLLGDAELRAQPVLLSV